jgi:hypothetical protein
MQTIDHTDPTSRLFHLAGLNPWTSQCPIQDRDCEIRLLSVESCNSLARRLASHGFDEVSALAARFSGEILVDLALALACALAHARAR